MFHLKQKLSRNPIRLLAVMLAMALVVTLTPYQAMTVQAEGEDHTLETDKGPVTWDFRDESAAIYTEDSEGNYNDGSLSVDRKLYINGDNSHGAVIQDGTTFSLRVPEGQTTITFGVCSYSHSTANIYSENNQINPALSLAGNGSGGADDQREESIQYTSNTDTTITIAVTGSGYLHYITAETITPPQVATVSGGVTGTPENSVDGENLIFTDSEGETVTGLIENGEYSVSLPIGKTYTVTFENSDVYEITDGGTINLTGTQDGASVTNNITYNVIWDTSKTFSFEIGGTTYSVTPGNSSSDNFDVSAEGDGSVELATTDTAIIWANLGGAGNGTLRADRISNVSDNVTYTISDNTITFTYTETATSPTEYSIQVKDNSASGTPHADGSTRIYDFTDGSVVSTLYTGGYSISSGASVTSTDKFVTLTGNNSISYNGAQHGIAISDRDTITVEVAGNAEITFALCAYSGEDGTLSAASSMGSISPESVPARQASDGGTQTFTYEGEAAKLTFTYSGATGYIHSMEVLNKAPESTITGQEELPVVMGYGNGDALTVTPGQRLIFEQEGGSLTSGAALSDSVSYYGFKATDALNRLEADITVDSCESGSSHGVFFGVFNGTEIETAGIRNSVNLRGLYTSSDGTLSAGGINETITEGETVHFTVERISDTQVQITAAPESGGTYTLTRDCEGEVSFGLILASASVTVTNMMYYNEQGEILYDQNDYSTVGNAPVITAAYADIADTRDGIVITWDCTEQASGDGRYVIQMRRSDSGDNWDAAEIIAETTESSYTPVFDSLRKKKWLYP